MSDYLDSNQHQDLAGVTACVLVNGDHIRWWQAHALQLAMARGLRISGVVDYTTPTPKQASSHNIGLSLLGLITLRTNALTKVPWRQIVGQHAQVARVVRDQDRNSQLMPTQAVAQLTGLKPDVIINFAADSGLDPSDLPAPCVILSFHHDGPIGSGDQAVCFYEVLNDAAQMNATIRMTADSADRGTVAASSAHQVISHSYSKTLEGLHRNSTHLLAKALVNLRSGITGLDPISASPVPPPNNRQVARLFGVLLHRKLSRALYGASRTKQWRVGRTERFDPAAAPGTVTLNTPSDYPVPPGFQFLADPLPGPNGTIWCEAMDTKTGLGRILVLTDDRPPQVIDPPGTEGVHLAYPFVVASDDDWYLIPEMSGAAPARIFRLEGIQPASPGPLLGLEDEHLVDPTFHHHEGRWWLFAGKPGSAADLLWLWSAKSVHGPYVPHPANPIVMDPSRARSGGPLFFAGGQLFRPGQNNTGAYGDGLTISRVSVLSPKHYVEEPILKLRVESRKGPHTLITEEGHLIIDSYVDEFDPLAWLHRLRSRLS